MWFLNALVRHNHGASHSLSRGYTSNVRPPICTASCKYIQTEFVFFGLWGRMSPSRLSHHSPSPHCGSCAWRGLYSLSTLFFPVVRTLRRCLPYAIVSEDILLPIFWLPGFQSHFLLPYRSRRAQPGSYYRILLQGSPGHRLYRVAVLRVLSSQEELQQMTLCFS